MRFRILAATDATPRIFSTVSNVPDAFGPGKSAEMTYYETAAGARVFAAGVMNFGGSALWPEVALLLDNLWARLSSP